MLGAGSPGGQACQAAPALSQLPAGHRLTRISFCLDLLQHKSFLKPRLQSSRLWGLPSSLCPCVVINTSLPNLLVLRFTYNTRITAPSGNATVSRYITVNLVSPRPMLRQRSDPPRGAPGQLVWAFPPPSRAGTVFTPGRGVACVLMEAG